MSNTIIGLAGFRRTGKSEIAKYLKEHHGFRSVHPFGIWKVGIEAMLREIGASEQEAHDMVHGHLKDTSSPLLPDDNACRFLMEKLGRYAGVELGSEWTIGLALKKESMKNPGARLVVESVVYEETVLRGFGAHIMRVDRPGRNGDGLDTDKATMKIVPDSVFINDGNDLELLHAEVDIHLDMHGLLCEKEDVLEIA